MQNKCRILVHSIQNIFEKDSKIDLLYSMKKIITISLTFLIWGNVICQEIYYDTDVSIFPVNGKVRLLDKSDLYGYGDENSETVTGIVLDTAHDDGSIQGKYIYKDGLLHGIYSWQYIAKEGFSPQNHIIQKQSFNMGILHGPNVRYYSNGNFNFIYSYKNGLVDSINTSYYENGQIYEIRNYEEGRAIGWFRRFSKDGKIIGEVNLKDGNGSFIVKDQSGKKLIEEVYVDGKLKNGIVKEWPSSINQTITGSSYDLEGNIRVETKWKDNIHSDLLYNVTDEWIYLDDKLVYHGYYNENSQWIVE